MYFVISFVRYVVVCVPSCVYLFSSFCMYVCVHVLVHVVRACVDCVVRSFGMSLFMYFVVSLVR